MYLHNIQVKDSAAVGLQRREGTLEDSPVKRLVAVDPHSIQVKHSVAVDPQRQGGTLADSLVAGSLAADLQHRGGTCNLVSRAVGLLLRRAMLRTLSMAMQAGATPRKEASQPHQVE